MTLRAVPLTPQVLRATADILLKSPGYFAADSVQMREIGKPPVQNNSEDV